MAEFISELENIMQAEELLFDPTPGFGPYKQYFPSEAVSHPAKMNTRLVEFLVEEFTEEGHTILDPMGGTGSTGVIAALHGRNSILVDIEEKFVEWMKEAKKIVDGIQTLTKKGKITILKGDARQLSKILNGVDSIVTSPPYSEGIGHDSGDNASEEFKERLEMQRRYTRQMTSEGNIAKLKHGSIDTVITSPPYADTKKGGEADEEKMVERWDKVAEDKGWNTWGKTWKTEGRKRALKSLGSGYSKSEENIGNLPVGNIDTVITSPPYADGFRHNPQNAEKRIKKLIEVEKQAVKKGQKWAVSSEEVIRRRYAQQDLGYGRSKENIGNLPHGNLTHEEISAIITSPPYSESVNAPNDPERRAERMRKAGLDPKTIVGGKARCGQIDWKYGDGKDNIGNLSHGEISAIITSPPYEESLSEKRHATPNTGRTEKLYKEKSLGSYPHSENQIGALKSSDKEYQDLVDSIITSPPFANTFSDWDKKSRSSKEGQTPYYSDERFKKKQNIGNIPYYSDDLNSKRSPKPPKGKETYLEAMLKVYSEMFKVLKEGGRAIIVVKPFIRNKQVIDLPYHTWLLMSRCGFILEKLYKLRLKQQSFWRVLYHRKYPEIPQLKHEYILVCKKDGGDTV